MAVEHTFTATIQIAGINPYVNAPRRISEALGGGPKIAVLVKVMAAGSGKIGSAKTARGRRLANDARQLRQIARLGPEGWFRTTLVASRSGGRRLYLDTWMRDMAGVGVGDRVRVRLKADRESRELPMPPLLRDALKRDSQAKAAWEALAPSRRREILTYLNFLKSPAALERNVQKTIAILIAKKQKESP